MFAVVHVPVIS